MSAPSQLIELTVRVVSVSHNSGIKYLTLHGELDHEVLDGEVTIVGGSDLLVAALEGLGHATLGGGVEHLLLDLSVIRVPGDEEDLVTLTVGGVPLVVEDGVARGVGGELGNEGLPRGGAVGAVLTNHDLLLVLDDEDEEAGGLLGLELVVGSDDLVADGDAGEGHM